MNGFVRAGPVRRRRLRLTSSADTDGEVECTVDMRVFREMGLVGAGAADENGHH
jgi:hypothetical protein